MKHQSISLLEKHLNSSARRCSHVGIKRKSVEVEAAGSSSGRRANKTINNNTQCPRDRNYLSVARQEIAQQQQRLEDAVARLNSHDSKSSKNLSKNRLKAILKLHTK